MLLQVIPTSLWLSLLLPLWTTAADPGIPDYVLKYAPLVFLDVNELYFPSDIGAQIPNTHLDLNFTPVAEPRNTDLTNLSDLNQAGGNCTTDDFDACPLYLTFNGNITSDPPWLHGVVPDSVGATNGAISCAVVVTDHGDGIVDAYYFYFYAFNLGLVIQGAGIPPEFAGRVAGNHLGDWEHTMTRFKNGQPQTIWFSAHDSGNVYTYDALSKNGTRHIVYSALGGHPNYPIPGIHSRNETVIILNDTTSAGPLWDPVRSAYFYTFTPTSSTNGTFRAAGSTPDAPIDWLYFLGRWGDKQYNASNPIQFNFLNLEHTWDDGPTGPLDKDLNRTETCPDRVSPCPTTTKLPTITGDPTPSQTVARTKTATVSSTTSELPASSSQGGAASSTPSGGYGPHPVYVSRPALYALGASFLWL
ncbi:hypothetical protein NA57DRAFT_73518 [Rhizodiscina lignyota]|uniref:Vacuolar protein sorting-associated protein 62 n=1 Tax=Rhizodiscina lignyota TaxID=1504668 RepID=A0A9P4II50_9PEZI|nr:hypothetical protein NA57DRAFT_73518 [Rhizodiscina lignyota]